jgi:hypothetical protein
MPAVWDLVRNLGMSYHRYILLVQLIMECRPSPSPNSPRDQLKVRVHSPSFQVRRDNFHGNGFMLPQDSKLESGTFDSKLEAGTSGALPLEVTSKDHASRSESASSNQVFGPVSIVSIL